MKTFDITILTDKRFVNPSEINPYIQNILDEDRLLSDALEKKGLKIFRTNWDNLDFDWTETEYILFRTTWDYFDRYEEFAQWLEKVSSKTKLINPKELIYWNIDKHYLLDLKERGAQIVDTLFINRGDHRNLRDVVNECHWKEFVLKPTVSGAARHTYRFTKDKVDQFSSIYESLIANEDMMLQEFQLQIITKGEIALMLFGGKFSHAVLKKAKDGDYRVQDDFGGTISEYFPNQAEIAFAEQVISSCEPLPIYARVDILWSNQDELCIGELELIEPELWFRMNRESATRCATALIEYINS